ncbi:MAG TPA: hypothetical protein VF691_05625 [Cytophagaceae bacterium]
MKAALVLFLFFTQCAFAQELFPSNESASPLAKNSFAARFSYENYKEPLGRSKHWAAARVMYGLTRNLTVGGSLTGSNHHLRKFPDNMLFYLVNHHKRTYKALPFILEGSHLYMKYRVFSKDGNQRHLRGAVFGEVSKSFTTHDVAEPMLMGDNSGIGGGIIITQLYRRLAFSITTGYITPFKYKDEVATFKSGNAIYYNFSIGYRAFPSIYRSVNDFNINFYVELMNKIYDKASITYRNDLFDIDYFKTEDYYTYLTLQMGKYSELRPAVQFILDATTRLDLFVGLPIQSRSYVAYYPTVNINFQKYFFSR